MANVKTAVHRSHRIPAIAHIATARNLLLVLIVAVNMTLVLQMITIFARFVETDLMYYYPGHPKSPYGLPMPSKKRGRPTDLSKLQAVQVDLFESDLLVAQKLLPSACLPARSEARTDSQPEGKAARSFRITDTGKNPGFTDLRRGSTADQSGLPDLVD